MCVMEKLVISNVFNLQALVSYQQKKKRHFVSTVLVSLLVDGCAAATMLVMVCVLLSSIGVCLVSDIPNLFRDVTYLF